MVTPTSTSIATANLDILDSHTRVVPGCWPGASNEREVWELDAEDGTAESGLDDGGGTCDACKEGRCADRVQTSCYIAKRRRRGRHDHRCRGRRPAYVGVDVQVHALPSRRQRRRRDQDLAVYDHGDLTLVLAAGHPLDSHVAIGPEADDASGIDTESEKRQNSKDSEDQVRAHPLSLIPYGPRRVKLGCPKVFTALPVNAFPLFHWPSSPRHVQSRAKRGRWSHAGRCWK
jgi:hypothetical protein